VEVLITGTATGIFYVVPHALVVVCLVGIRSLPSHRAGALQYVRQKPGRR